MAYNQNLVQTEEVVFTATTVVLGFGSGQIVPPRYLVCEPTGNMTITLPLSTAQLPTSSSTQYIPGAGPGYPITIYNNSTTPYTVTIVAATATSPAVSDTLQNIPALTLQNSSVSVFASPSENLWYGFAQESGSANTIANTELTYPLLTASSTSFTGWIADAAYILTGVKAVEGTISSVATATVTVEKATGTTALGSGTALLATAISLNGTANVVASGALIATTASLTFAAGDRLNVLLGASLTALATCTVSVGLRRLV